MGFEVYLIESCSGWMLFVDLIDNNYLMMMLKGWRWMVPILLWKRHITESHVELVDFLFSGFEYPICLGSFFYFEVTSSWVSYTHPSRSCVGFKIIFCFKVWKFFVETWQNHQRLHLYCKHTQITTRDSTKNTLNHINAFQVKHTRDLRGLADCLRPWEERVWDVLMINISSRISSILTFFGKHPPKLSL